MSINLLSKERRIKMANYSDYIKELMKDYKLMSRASFLVVHNEEEYQTAKREVEKQQHEERIDGLRYGQN